MHTFIIILYLIYYLHIYIYICIYMSWITYDHLYIYVYIYIYIYGINRELSLSRNYSTLQYFNFALLLQLSFYPVSRFCFIFSHIINPKVCPLKREFRTEKPLQDEKSQRFGGINFQ